MSYNKGTILGRITKDTEIQVINKEGNQFEALNFIVAVDQGYKEDSGTDFIPVSFTGAKAKAFEKFIKKGVLVLVEGKMRINYSGEGENSKQHFKIAGESINVLSEVKDKEQ